MRMPRIKLGGTSAVQHCISRVVRGQMLLNNGCKDTRVEILGALARFCGVEVITYCVMSNHFHILIRDNRHTLRFGTL